jgi:predicted DNA-binding transcriptional regulator YafY
MSSRWRNGIIRKFNIIFMIQSRSRGITVNDLVEEVSASRATIYRDLEALLEAGAPIQKDNLNGETRYRLLGDELPPLRPTPRQLAALTVARLALSPLEGTSFVREIDQLLQGFSGSGSNDSYITLRRSNPVGPDKVQIIDNAIQKKQRIRIRYRGAKDPRPVWRNVDPLALHLAGDDLYLIAFDLDRDDWRTFKAVRISHVTPLGDKAAAHPGYEEKELFKRSVKIWRGEEVDVAIRVASDVARIASEWPLVPDQSVEDLPDGSVIIRARVSGIVETTRWVLGWGKNAEALSPSSLRKAVHQELDRALSNYVVQKAKTLKQPVSRIVRQGSGN